MDVIAKASEIPAPNSGKRVLVPTMGALHEGHLSLIRQARGVAGAGGEVAVSIFVNPIQFDRADDLQSYPQPLDADLEACRQEGVDLVFAPEAGSMYFPDRSIKVVESALSNTLCGATRPGHFDGACTVVLKLFNLLQPTAAVFGEKDYQQLAIIRRMVRDLDVPVDIIGGPTLREPDGLAMSSRNLRLTAEQRADAPRIHQALANADASKDASHLLEQARSAIESPLNEIDYLELVDAETLQTTTNLTRPVVLAAAVFYGGVRLIDNVIIQPATSL